MGKRRLTRPSSTTEKRRARSTWIPWVVLGGLVAVIGGFIVYYTTNQNPAEAARTGRPAPEFTLRLLNGQSISLASLRGRPVLLSFWHST